MKDNSLCAMVVINLKDDSEKSRTLGALEMSRLPVVGEKILTDNDGILVVTDVVHDGRKGSQTDGSVECVTFESYEHARAQAAIKWEPAG